MIPLTPAAQSQEAAAQLFAVDAIIHLMERPCIHPKREPPSLLCLRPGQVRNHTCPRCGRTITLTGSTVTL